MKAASALALFCALALASAASGAPRSLLQSAAPPNARFGGPAITLNEVAAPAGTFAKINWRGVGTQNYSSASNSQYVAAGGVADMFLQNGTKVGQFFSIKNGDGSLSSVFTRQNAAGQLLGTVIGSQFQTQQAPASNDDGGFGSIPELLLKVSFADGFFSGVTFIQRINTLGGVVPGNPKLFTLPAAPFGTANFLLAVPFQADYLFLAPGSPPAATG